jgi:hypothetical protein
MPVLRPQLLAAFSRHCAADARHRTIPPRRVPETFRRHQPQPPGPARAHLQRPQILGIDEHFFTRRHGYATTFCDLKNHKIYDVVLGRSEASLEGYLARLEGKHLVQLVCMDLATGYRALVRKHFPQAKIVADRFHVIRTVNHHFLACCHL